MKPLVAGIILQNTIDQTFEVIIQRFGYHS